jgi:diacylglycerol kinase family enzyme
MKVLLLVNSSASSVTARSRVVIQKALSADHEVTLAETSRRGHATRLAQGAAAAGTEVVVVLGGDGTLNEAANGLARSTCALAPLPGGSTNVFARTIGLPNDPIEATGDLLDSLALGRIQRVGLGSVNGRYFLFHVGMGFDAAVVAQVERRSGLKRYAGHPLFVYAGFDTALRHYDRSRPRFSVRFPDGSVVDDGYLCICLNTSPYTYLGNRPLDLAPEATLERGLASVTVRTLAFTRMMRIIASALTNGRHLRTSRWTDHRTDLTELTVTGYGPFPYQVDGDYLGDTEELVLRHEPAVLDLVMPGLSR